MSKNVFDYIKMGLRSKKTIEDKKEEAQLKKQHEANAFDKAFTDKTYTVAKKVLDNVEKVADYDYDALFDRVNKVIDNKLPKSTKTITPKDREYRSKEFDEKVSSHPDRFNIDDYINKQKNYKDSIIEKTKKNIQKKYNEADQKQKVTTVTQTSDKTDNISFEIKLDIDKILNKVTPIIQSPDLSVSDNTVDESKSTIESIDNITNIDDISSNELVSDNDILVTNASEVEVVRPEDKHDPQIETDVVEVNKEDPMITDANHSNTVLEVVVEETKPIEDKTEDNTPLMEVMVDDVLEEPSIVIDIEKAAIDVVIDETITDEVIEEPIIDEVIEEPFIDEVIDEPLIDEVIEEPLLDEVIEEPLVDEVIEEPLVDEVIEEPFIDEVVDEPLIDEFIEEILIEETIVEKSSPRIEEDKTALHENTTRVSFDTETLDKQYSKEELNRHNKYYKNKKRDKFAKRMKVELEDSLIGQKKRSFNRLFKFSLSFKLSFVFMLLIVLTVVSLSIAFYLGIDYVIELKEIGKLDDIQFFKDVLIVLLIIFDMAAILICISLGTKASRELVRPIDEMTQIVNQISAKDMNRRLDVKGMHDELKELAMTFNEMLDRIENSYETQNRFTSDASHELRTPIAVIQGYINMLDRWGKADGEILDESIEAIKSESHNMKRLTEKLLLLAKADKGILEMDFQSFELNELISEISRETLMIDSSHEITNEINEVKTILADRESLKQAIRIFVDNSVKYTPEGGKISINSYINKKKIYIEIADNGIGISKEDMDNIFNRFYRVDKSRTKDSGGHGLGLSIAKWIISQHKGEIEIKSELNKGTVVTLILSPIKE